MSSSDNLLDSVISGKLELDCVRMKLTQNGSDNPTAYEGSGTIFQDEDGFLHLKMYSVIANLSEELKSIFAPVTPGAIFGSEHYYSLEATDMSGHVWKLNRLYINKSNVSTQASAMIIKANPREITYISERKMPERTVIALTIAGKHSIPCNKAETFPNGGWILNTLVFTTEDNIEFSFKKSDDRLDIRIDGPTVNMPDDFEQRVTLSLSIILGRNVNPCFILKNYADIAQTTIKSVALHQSDKVLPSPISHGAPEHLVHFQKFIIQYIKNPGAATPSLFGYWHKVNSAYQGDISIMALALSVAIEGLVKEHFQSYGHVDKTVLKASDDAVELINQMEIDKVIAKRLISSLGMLKNQSPKAALYEIAGQGWFPTKLVDQWVSLRNESAHADKLNMDEQKMQKYLDKIHSCLSLFYRLIFLIISYEGFFVDYSTKGWPDKEFKIEDKKMDATG